LLQELAGRLGRRARESLPVIGPHRTRGYASSHDDADPPVGKDINRTQQRALKVTTTQKSTEHENFKPTFF